MTDDLRHAQVRNGRDPLALVKPGLQALPAVDPDIPISQS